MHTLAQLAHAIQSNLEPYFLKVLPELEKAMNETQGYDLILDTLIILRKLFRGTGNVSSYQANYSKINDIIQKALNHEYSKVVSEGLRVTGQFVYVLRTPNQSTIDQQFVSVVPKLYNAIRAKLVKTDIDQEVKQCSIIAIANLLTVCHKSMSSDQI